MKFSVLAETFENMEKTTKRLELTDLLVDLFKKTLTNDFFCIHAYYTFYFLNRNLEYIFRLPNKEGECDLEVILFKIVRGL